MQREVADGDTVSLGYNFNRGVHLIRPLDVNVYQAGTNEQGRPIVGFHNPLVLQDNIYGSWANSSYHAWSPSTGNAFSMDSPSRPLHLEQDHVREHRLQLLVPTATSSGRQRGVVAVFFHPKHNFVAYTVVDLPCKAGTGRRIRSRFDPRLHGLDHFEWTLGCSLQPQRAPLRTWATATPTPTAPGVWAATPASGPTFSQSTSD